MKAKGKVVPVEKRYLPARGAKSYLECSDEYLKKLRDTAKVTFHRDGKMIRYDMRSIDLFISQHPVVKQRTR